VGQTAGDPHERASQLYTTGVPDKFNVEFAKKVKDHTKKEKMIHSLLEKHFERPTPGREFFKCSSADVFEFFELIEGTYLVNADRPDPGGLRQFEYKPNRH
jgi:hypothetical protein